jgi:mono/diheme cytochrome c family protein
MSGANASPTGRSNIEMIKRIFRRAELWLAALFLLSLAAPAPAQRRRPNRPPPVSLPKGPVRQVLLDNCTTCHGIEDYAFFALDRAGWNKLLESKHKELKSIITDERRGILLDYLAGTFGPDSKPFAPAQDRQATDNAIKRILDTICSSCHTLDRINTAKHDEEMWRSVIDDMRNKGARIDDKDVDILVAYLVKTQPAN